jgi:hypothetical protein
MGVNGNADKLGVDRKLSTMAGGLGPRARLASATTNEIVHWFALGSEMIIASRLLRRVINRYSRSSMSGLRMLSRCASMAGNFTS